MSLGSPEQESQIIMKKQVFSIALWFSIRFPDSYKSNFMGLSPWFFWSRYSMDNMMDGLYIAPAFMDKLVVHVAKNFMNLPNIKVDLITIFFPPLSLSFVVFFLGVRGCKILFLFHMTHSYTVQELVPACYSILRMRREDSCQAKYWLCCWQVPLILGIWGGKGQGKSFQCELVMSKLGIK